MDFSQFDLTDPFVRRALAETLAEDNGLDYQDEYIRKALNDEIAAAAAPKPIDGERNFFGDTVSRLARGGVQLADTAIHAVDTAVGGSETLQGWSDSLDKAKQNVGLLRPDKSEHEEGWLKRSYGQALESAPMSAAPWAGAMAGASMGAVAGPAGAVAGGLIGGTLAMGGLFGLGTYGQRKEEVERELTATRPDLTPDEISKMAHDNAKNHAFAETGGESAGDLASWAILSKVPGGQAIFKGGKAVLAELVKPNAFKAIALGVGKSMPFEVGSEVGTAIWQNEADKAIGVEQGTSTDAALAAIGPAMFLSAGMGVAVGGYSANQRRVQYNALNSEDQESRAQAVDQVAGTLAEATDQQTAKKWRDMALGFVQNGQPIPLDMNLAELSANEPEAAIPEAQDQPAENILKAESVDEAIQEAEAEIAKPGWLAPTAPDLEESAWLQQGVAAKAYNQGRNELGATPVSRAGLLGQAMAGSTDIDKTLNEISLERNTMGRVVPEESLLAQQGDERTDGQRQAEAAAERLDRELEYQRLFEQIDQMEGNKAKNELMDKLVSEYQNSGPGWIHYDHGNIAGIENQWTMRNTDEVVSSYSPEFAATRPTTAMLPPPPWMHTKTTPTDEEFTEWLRQRRTALDYLQKRNAKPVKEKATTWSVTENDAKNMQMDAEVSRYQTGAPGWLHGDMEDINGGANVGRGKVSGNQGTVAAVQPEQPAGVRDTEPVSEDSGQLGDGEGGAGVEQEPPLLTATSKRDAMGRGPKPTRAADEPARAFLARKREWEEGDTSSQHNGEHPTQAPNINPLEKPWMLTKEEYHRAIQSRFGMGAEARQSVGAAFSAGRGGALAEGVPYRQVNYEQHARKVARAIRSGEAVPAGVLAEYPGYLEKYRRPPATRKRELEESAVSPLQKKIAEAKAAGQSQVELKWGDFEVRQAGKEFVVVDAKSSEEPATRIGSVETAAIIASQSDARRKKEASVSQTGGNKTQAELPRTDETQAGDQGGGQGEYDYDLSAVWRGRAPQVAAPTVLKSTTGGKEYAIPGLEELRVTVKPPYGNKAKHTKLGWSVYVGDNLIWANLPGVADTAENAINSARGKLKRIHAAIAKDQAHTTPKTTSTSDLPSAGTVPAPSSGEASNVAAEMKKLVASIKKSDAKLEKLHEGQLNRMKNGGQSRATSTTYAARAGNEAKHRDGEARVLANIARAELRAGRAVPQDVIDILGSKIEYNRNGDYEPIEGVTAPSPGEASPPPAAQPSASKATPEKPAGVATSGQRLPADYDPASDEGRFYGSKVTIKEQRARNGKVFRKETTGRVDRVLKGSSGGNVFEVVPDGYEDAFRYDEGDIVIDELVDNKADKKDEVAPVKSGRPSPGQFVPASKEYNSTAQGQKDMSARGSRIAMLKGLNRAVGKVYTDGEIEGAADENIDAIRDYLIERQRQEQAADAKPRKDADMADVPETDFGNIKEGEIYQTTVSGKKMYAIRGDNPRGGGDSLFGTRGEAQAEIERAAKMKAANEKSMAEAEAKEDAKNKAEAEREAKRKAELAGKQTLWFDEEYIAGLSAMARGRLMEALDKRYNTRDGERTLREYIESGGFTGTDVSEVPVVQYNRAKYNRMDSRAQAEYDKKLEEKKTEYRVTRDDDTSFQIPKIVFDAIRKDAAQPAQAEAASGERGEVRVYSYSNTQVRVTGEAARMLVAMGREIPEGELYIDPNDPSYGRETEPHITVRYGLAIDDAAPLAELSGVGQMTATFGKVSIFAGDKYDVVKVEVISPDLHKANKKVGNLVDVPGETFKDYQPHATIAYVKPGEGKKYVGRTDLEGIALDFDEIDLVNRDGETKSIRLQQPAQPAQAEAASGERGEEDGIVEHTTRRGKVLRGRIVTGISYRQAKAADPYTFKKDGGFFIREGAGEVKKDDAPAEVKETAPEKAEAQPKENLAIKRLRMSAERLKAAGEAKLNQDRNANTARRARMANNAEADARADIRTAETLLNIVNAQEDGTAGALAGLTSKAQLETLQGILTQAKYAEERKKENGKQDHARPANKDDIKSAVYLYPHFYDYKDLDALIDLLGNKKGWRTKRNDLRRGGLVVNGKERIEMLREALKLAGDDYRFRTVGEHLKGYDRLQKAGITDDLALREALEKLVELSGKAPEKNRAQELERALVGQNNGIDFFPTPKAQAKFIVDRAGIEPGMRVLEPSAGTGNLAEEMRAQGGEVEVAEISPAHREVLEAKGFKIVEHDFMDMEEGGYDVIVMNPPFSNNMDIDHVRKAYELLKPGGRVVAIMGEGAFFRTGKKETEFREWLDEVGINEKLPEGFFTDKKELRTTGVNARVVEIDKPIGAETPVFDEKQEAVEAEQADPTEAPIVEPEAIPEQRLLDTGFLREFRDRWQYKLAGNNGWFTADRKEDAVERARKAYEKTPEPERLTAQERFDKSTAEQNADIERLYGDNSLPELRKEYARMEREIASLQKAGRREFDGNGGRRTGAAVSNEGARNIGEQKLKLGRYIEDREKAEKESTPTRLHTVSGYPSDNATKKHMLEAIAEARKELPEPSPKDGFGNAERIDWPKPTTEKSHKIYRLAGNFKLVVDPTGYARLVEDMGSSGNDGSKIPDKVHGKPIGNLAEAKLWAEYYLLGKAEPSGPPHVFRGKNKEYEYTIPNSAYALDNFEKKVKGSSGVKFSERTGPTLESIKAKYAGRIDTIFVHERNDGDIHLASVIVGKGNRQQGVGSEFMADLVAYADANGKRIVLSPGQPDDRHGTTSRARLVRFYKRFGFIENKGRNKDYQISEGMYRVPAPKYSTALPPSSRADIPGELTQAFGKLRARVLMRKIIVLESQEEVKALVVALQSSGVDDGKFSLREKPAPKKTVKGYKLFRVDKRYPGKLFPLFVGANEAIDTGVWLDAEAGELTPAGKVKSKLGPLAYRPGWHGGDLPIATHIGQGGTPPTSRPANQVWAEVEFAAEVDWQAEAERRATKTKSGNVIPRTAHITDQVPADGLYRYKTNPNMTGQWIISGAMKVNRVLTDAEVESINDAAGVADLPRVEPFDAEAFGVKYSKNGAIQGIYANGKTYLVADGIAKNQAVPVLLHELGEHAAQLGFAGDREYQGILRSLEKRAEAQNATGKAIRAAMARVPEDTLPEHYWSEVAAYLVENKANGEIGIVKRILNFFKRWLYKAGAINADRLTPEDLVLFARSATLAHTGATYGEGVRQSVRDLFKPVDTESAAFSDGPVNYDPDQGEAEKVQSGIEGKSVADAVQFIVENAPAEKRIIAERVLARIEEMQRLGVSFTLNIAHRFDRVPQALVGTRGLSYTRPGFKEVEIWLQGADVDGFVGTSYETALHEFVHAVTQAALEIGRQGESNLLPVAKELHNVCGAIADHIRSRKDNLTEYEKDMVGVGTGTNNILQSMDEILAYGLSSRKFQEYLETIPYKQENMWTRFVAAIRKVLGLEPKGETALTGLLRVGERLFDSKAEWALPDFGGSVINSARGELLNNAAFVRAEADERNPPPIEGTTTEDPYEQAAKIERNKYLALRRSTSATLKSIAGGVDKYLGAISTRLRNISPKLEHKIRQLDFNIGTNHTRDVRAVEPLLKLAKQKMSKMDFIIWDLARKNSDVKRIDDLVKKYGIRKEYDAYRKVLDRMFKEAQEVGIELGWINEYAPRVIKDPQGFLNELGRGNDWPVLTQKLKEVARRMDITVADMTPEMKADIISNMLFSGYYGMGAPGSTKERSIAMIPPNLNQYYMDSDAALMQYLHSMRKHIEARRFFGKVPQKISEAKRNMHAAMKRLREEDAKEIPDQARMEMWRDSIAGYRGVLEKYKNQRDYTDNIAQYVIDLMESGELSPENENVLKDILNARFNEHGTRGVIQAYKNFSYLDTMGSPISAITQIGDLAWSIYANGWTRTLRGISKSALGKAKITKEDVGIERIAQEFADTDTLSKAVAKVFRWIGLEKMDTIGKESFLNGAFERFVAEAKKDPKALERKLEQTFEEDAALVVDDLQNERITENVKLLVYSDLLNFQPAAMSEMPEQYLLAGNGRLFYMLKTYTLKQFDVFRREGYNAIRSGAKAEKIDAVRKVAYLAMLLVLANGAADELKDWLLGRKTDLSDRVTDNVLRLFGVSKYMTWKARTEGYGSAIVRQILPPFKFVDSLSKDILSAGDGKGLQTPQSVPVVGKLAYWHLGRGKDAHLDLWEIRFSKERRRLEEIKERVEENPDLASKYRQEMRRLKAFRRAQYRINQMKSASNKLRQTERRTGSDYSARIDAVEQRRIAAIKRFLGAQQ